MRELIHFAHGNGFPSPCYKQLLQALQTRYDCCYIDRIGHNQQFPVTDNWHFLIEEVIASIVQQAKQPVIAIGHSFGGVLSLLAAIERPSLFKSVIMIDAPLFGRLKSCMLQVAKVLKFIDRVTPASRTRGRREHWENREQIVAYLKKRELFKSFTQECLEDYIDYGLKKTDDGYRLRFDPYTEYLIFRTLPHNLHQYEGKLTRPAAMIYGETSNVVSQTEVRYLKKHYNIESYPLKGSHMLPMEHPLEVAEQIFNILDILK